MKKIMISALMALGFAFSAAAQQTYVVDSGFERFSWDGGVGTTSEQGGFSFTLATAGELTVTDAFFFGDRFDILVNTLSVGQTSVVTNQGSNVGADPVAAIAAGFSNATIALAAGAYVVDFALFQDALDTSGNPFSSGAAFFKVDSVSAVPEPATWLMMILGFAFTGLALRRRKLKTA
ncbi:PEPxxWA-CTERM sorting domain-containing protein [Kordiimonas sp. SCSIO 12610]|uniref:PEPxxWA-CTERM sorting domain-containing protein n=1 Tax=Kordiimonas sp. SCSIO 12610 TaxID=2829597 RepID=UPI0021091140|nr:PEPxxWA-CTERM sorting domain-containing protein [Kordiimonas sp. SCSIO 12610]UTW56059.1 PEP-CTERM sorting domain-containing protein [Kordiimonas sp. SCSIO 12610]